MNQIFGPSIDINFAEVFVMKNEHSYAAFVGILSNIYMKAHASSVFRTRPYIAALVIDEKMISPYKNQPDSSFTRIKEIINRMKQPAGRIKLGVFLSNDGMFKENSKVGLKHTVSQCWPIERLSKSRKYITLNLPPSQLQYNENIVRYFEYDDVKKHVDNDIQLIDYDTSINQLFDYLNQSYVHISYQGGTSWISVAMNVPTIVVHPTRIPTEFHLKFKLFGQDLGNINVLDDNDKIEHVRLHPAEHHIHIADLKETIEKVMI